MRNQVENNELIYIPREEFHIFMREDDGHQDLMLSTNNAVYEVIHGLGEGAGNELSEIIRDMYMLHLCDHVTAALSGQDKLIDVMSIYEEIADHLQNLVQNKTDEEVKNYEDTVSRGIGCGNAAEPHK